MKTRVRRWGSGVALRISRRFAEELGVCEGAEVHVTVRGGEIVVAPVRRRTWALERLLAGVRKRNLHGDLDPGPSRGRESW